MARGLPEEMSPYLFAIRNGEISRPPARALTRPRDAALAADPRFPATPTAPCLAPGRRADLPLLGRGGGLRGPARAVRGGGRVCLARLNEPNEQPGGAMVTRASFTAAAHPADAQGSCVRHACVDAGVTPRGLVALRLRTDPDGPSSGVKTIAGRTSHPRHVRRLAPLVRSARALGAVARVKRHVRSGAPPSAQAAGPAALAAAAGRAYRERARRLCAERLGRLAAVLPTAGSPDLVPPGAVHFRPAAPAGMDHRRVAPRRLERAPLPAPPGRAFGRLGMNPVRHIATAGDDVAEAATVAFTRLILDVCLALARARSGTGVGATS